MVNKFKIIVGDEYGDGHNIREVIIIKSNYSHDVIYENYKKAKELTKIKFDYDEKSDTDLLIGVWYDKEIITQKTSLILSKYNVEHYDSDYYMDDYEEFIELFFNFIKIVLPDLKWEIIEDDIPRFPISIGYGLFH